MLVRMRLQLFVIGLGVLLSGAAQALDGNALLQKIDRNLQPTSYEMYRKLINVEPNGNKKEFVLYTVKKGQVRESSLTLGAHG